MSKELVITEEEMAKFEDEESCFGHKDEDVGYCAEEDCCKECPFAKSCKAICIDKKTPVLEPENAIASEKATDTPRTEEEVDRPYILALVSKVCESHDMPPEIKNSTTRDKVFLGDDDVFVVTNRALKINRLESGKKLGIDDAYWTENNKGVTVNYTNEIDWEKVVHNALDGLYVESVAKTDTKPKDNLFSDVESDIRNDTKPVEKPPSKKTGTTQTAKLEENVPAIVTEEITEAYSLATLDYGSIKKSLQIIEYANGYTEVRVISKASAKEIMERVEAILV